MQASQEVVALVAMEGGKIIESQTKQKTKQVSEKKPLKIVAALTIMFLSLLLLFSYILRPAPPRYLHHFSELVSFVYKFHPSSPGHVSLC